MTEQTFYIDTGKENIISLDTDEYGDFMAITDHNTILSGNYRIDLALDVKNPIIRKIDDESFLLASDRIDKPETGFIIDLEGKIRSSFNLGEGINDIVIQ